MAPLVHNESGAGESNSLHFCPSPRCAPLRKYRPAIKMEAAASTIAILGFALTSVKTCYQLFSDFKEGHAKLSDIFGALRNLQSALQQVVDTQGLSDILTTTPSLRDLVSRCNSDMKKFEAKLKKLDISTSESKYGVLFKKFKVHLDEKDLAHMLAVVTGYVDSLTLEISLYQT